MTGLKTFLRAPLAPIFTNFEGRARAEKPNFWSKFSKKCIKTLFMACFLKKLPAAKKIWSIRGFIVIWESSENQYGPPNKNPPLGQSCRSNIPAVFSSGFREEVGGQTLPRSGIRPPADPGGRIFVLSLFGDGP